MSYIDPRYAMGQVRYTTMSGMSESNATAAIVVAGGLGAALWWWLGGKIGGRTGSMIGAGASVALTALKYQSLKQGLVGSGQ